MKVLLTKRYVKRYISLAFVFCIGISLYVPLEAYEVQEENNNISMEGEPRLNYTEATKEGVVAENTQLQGIVEKYFSLREEVASGKVKEVAVMEKVSILADSDTVLQREAKRAEGRENLAIYHGVYVQDWTNHIYIENEEVVSSAMGDGKEALKLEVYEWNWIVYNNGKGGPQDEMGFATTHEMILEKDAAGIYQIVADEYDESDFLGKKDKTYAEIVEESICDTLIKETSDIRPMNSLMSVPSGYTIPSGSSVGSNKKGSVSYNVQAVRKYADTYVGHSGVNNSNKYNKNYTEFSGNDCANYVSQCLMAGGMRNDYGPNNTPNFYNNTDQWWYNPSKNNNTSGQGIYETCPHAWRLVPAFETYWTKQGYSKVTATASTVFPGNPVYSSGHLTICVGYNAANHPILNGHTDDWYHVPLSFFLAKNSNLKTIQLVSVGMMSSPYNATSITPTTQKQSMTLTLEQGQPIFLKFTGKTGKKLYISSSTVTNSQALDVEAFLYKERGPMVSDSQNDSYYICMDQLAYDDDSGEGVNFSIQGYAVSNAVQYYIEIRGITPYIKGKFIFNYWWV